jgi:MFS family permease
MIIGVVEPAAVVEFGIRVVAVAFGVLLLVQGWRLTWLFGGVASFVVALLVVRLVSKGLLGSSAVSGHLSWMDLVAVLAAMLGAVAALNRSVLAYGVIGLTAGGALCVWGAQVVGNGPEATFWVIMACIAAMALGALFTIHYEDVALILLSAVVGVTIIAAALGLSGQAQWEAALVLGLALVGIAVQCHDYQLHDGRAVGSRSSASP